MKKKKVVKIKNPELRRIRDNLRNILLQAASKEWNRLFNEQDKVFIDSNGNPKKMSLEEKSIFHELQEKMDRIHHISKNSICDCATCSAIDRDMVYNPYMKTWFCTECYQLNQQFYRHSHPELYP